MGAPWTIFPASNGAVLIIHSTAIRTADRTPGFMRIWRQAGVDRAVRHAVTDFRTVHGDLRLFCRLNPNIPPLPATVHSKPPVHYPRRAEASTEADHRTCSGSAGNGEGVPPLS